MNAWRRWGWRLVGVAIAGVVVSLIAPAPPAVWIPCVALVFAIAVTLIVWRS